MSQFENHSTYLPPVRKKVFRHSLSIVALYIVVGIFMMAAVFLASGITPKAIHLNYDSIAAASQMSHAWNALENPAQHPEKTRTDWVTQFENALAFEEKNITEPGESTLANAIRKQWNDSRNSLNKIEQKAFTQMESNLDRLVSLNESGMFGWAQRSQQIGRRVFILTVALFFVTILIALYLADGLAIRIADPLKELSSALRRKPLPGQKLKLPKPTSLEIRILCHELGKLWQRISDLQKLNLETISTQRQELETVLTAVEDAILVLDNQDRVLHCNDGISKIIGSSLEMLMNQPWRDLSNLSPNYLKLRASLKPEMTSDELIELDRAGKMRVFSGRCRPIFDEKGEKTGSLYLLHDITEIKQKDRLKTEFIGVLSHELKTPLQSLGTASELLIAKKDTLDEESKMLIETIYDDVNRIKGVANEFTQVGLVDLHSLRLKIETVCINERMQRWIQPFQILAKDRGVKIEFIKEGSSTITAKIDPVKFPWAITNLLSNAIRVSPPGGTVGIYVTDREKRVDIEVRDEGPGISEDVQLKMFDPYFQAGDRTSGFLGLGLTITKEVVEAHEGQIDYFPRSPQGSTFRISIPLLL